MNRDIVVVHTSDVHVDHDYTARIHGGDGTAGLACVLNAARGIGADLVLLVGDTFESHRLPQNVLDRTAAVIAEAGLPVVLLPGNHDPAIPEAVFRRGLLSEVANLHVLGVTHDEAVDFPHLDLEVWGRAHRDYGDMVPLEAVRPRRTRWQIALAHGHYEPLVDRNVFPRPSWLISDAEIAATGADYVALGHWNRAVRVGNGRVAAYYSGSPEYTGAINVVRLTGAGAVQVTQHALDIPREVMPVYVPD
jgi:DNA repair exonuclease SbcCD nuclease subunit